MHNTTYSSLCDLNASPHTILINATIKPLKCAKLSTKPLKISYIVLYKLNIANSPVITVC